MTTAIEWKEYQYLAKVIVNGLISSGDLDTLKRYEVTTYVADIIRDQMQTTAEKRRASTTKSSTDYGRLPPNHTHYWPCACVKGKLPRRAIKMNHPSIDRCKACGCTRPEGHIGEMS